MFPRHDPGTQILIEDCGFVDRMPLMFGIFRRHLTVQVSNTEKGVHNFVGFNFQQNFGKIK